MECAAGVRVVAEEFRRALRAEFDAPEKIGLRPGETVEPGWPEMGGGTENLRVRREADGGAAPVRRCAQLLQAAGRMPARKALAEQFLVPRDLDHRVGRKRVHPRYAHAMQAAGCRIGPVGNFSARMPRGHDDLKRDRNHVAWGKRVSVWVDLR